MKRRLIQIGTVLPLMVAMVGCLSLGAGLSPAQPQQYEDHYQLTELSERSAQGCRFDYRIFEPDKPISSTTVLLGHGFLRNQDRLVGLSKALANAGVRTVTLNFCNMRPWNGNHLANGQDMHKLAMLLGDEDDIIFGGFSAGALAAVLAANERTKAVFVLDFVDQAELGQNALNRLQVPLIGLHGPDSSCNAQGKGRITVEQHLRALDLSDVQYELVNNASHCEFESPSNWLCKAVCSDDDSAEENLQTRRFIIDRSIELIKLHLTPLVPESAIS